jgi:sigma-B regulation protein RsbU (phosphoserine phosphatase)
MSPDRAARELLPEPVRRILDEFRKGFGLDIRLWRPVGKSHRVYLYPGEEASSPGPRLPPPAIVRHVAPRNGPALVLEVTPVDGEHVAPAAADVLQSSLEQLFDFEHEISFFTFELSERYEEINLLYSISETLGSILHLDEASQMILAEVADVMGANAAAMWVFDPELQLLQRVASVGQCEGAEDSRPPPTTAQVFQEGRPFLARGQAIEDGAPAEIPDVPATTLSVPIRYTPPSGEPRTVGVIDLFGRRRDEPFNTSDQKLLSAIASQVGAAVENSRLVREIIAKEGMTREMELAHNLQMKLLSSVESFDQARVAARVKPAESVGGDFYHLIRLSGDRLGVMIGDVSSHGFPAALIMALSMSAATIYASEVGTPALVLRHLDDALRDELETTEMYLTLFYGVLDPEKGELIYSNAGHPHAFLVHGDGSAERLYATDPPVGIAGSGAFGQERVPFDRTGDLLLLFTDGLSDTLARTDRRSGERLVVEEVARRRSATPGEIVDALFALADDSTPSIPSDDRTAIVLGA